MQVLKYIFGTFVIIFGLVTLFNGIAGLPEGIYHMRQGRPASSGAASGGILFGPLIIWGGIALWRSGLRQSKLAREPEVSAADRVLGAEESAD